MLYDVTTPQEYLNALSVDWRKETLMKIRSLILEQHTQIEECIEYKMLSYRLEDIALFHLNSQKNYVSLYVGDIKKIDPTGTSLDGLSLGKGCIRFSKTKNVAESGLGDFITKAIGLAKQGIDVGC